MKVNNTTPGLLIALSFFSLLKGSAQGPHERRLLNDLLRDYNVMERPVANESDPLLLSFGVTLQQLIDVDEKNEQIVTNLWLSLDWVDVNLRWNVSQYGGIRDVRIAPKYLWKPDVLMYNSADERIDSTFPTNVVVQHNGSCSYIPPGIFKSTCKIDITWFPFDDQKCVMKFGSWTYDGNSLDLLLSSDEADLSNYVVNGEWDLIEFPGVRNIIYYTCCPQPYVDITFTLHIRRRTLYYGFNLIIPCVLISSMALLGFALPPDSGEKLTLGTYFACTMVMVAFSVVMTVVVLNYHHRNSDTHEMPRCIKSIFLVWLPWVLRMSRPGRKMREKSLMFNSKMKDLEMKERSSRSLLANVLDIDDDFRPAYSTPGYLHVSNDDNAAIHSCIITQREISAITRELRFITNHLREDDDAKEIIAEWKFAAMVIDRVCLIMFTIFTMVSTFLCLFSAPHLAA
ncbi:neuronal acetylcholine receptor subunit alpha-7-like isoform X3 [Limulus polyphemus]|uniref:Neuronal acetylcholine receptor subunit alpha-7-like isoform X3 n=1 Tax=Limulus polyphemus TaxID=6850 RepID=A0ABM1S0V9_LIMPO|nr:neuronal acetylcholine receptor subunit alpha-7-like isoform X3 [Limulus polyphemus]